MSLKTDVFKIKYLDGVCIVEFNDTNKSLNAFSRDSLADLNTILDEELAKQETKGLVFLSSKKNCFAVGVDVSIIESLSTQELGEQASRNLHALFKKFES